MKPGGHVHILRRRRPETAGPLCVHLSFYHKNRHIPPPILLKRLFAPADRPPMNPAGGSLPGTPWWKGRGWI